MSPKKFNELSIELTHKCALDCIYCSSNANINNNVFIDFDRIKEVIQETKDKFYVNTISLSGGETFLYPKLDQLFDFLKKNELKVLLYTSGIILDENGQMTSIPEHRLKKFFISKDNPQFILNIQGHTRNLIEKINGVEGSYKIIEQSIHNLVNQNIFLGAHIVPFSYNYKYLKEIVEFCKNHLFNEIHFLRFVPQGKGCQENLYLNRGEFSKVIDDLIIILKSNNADPKALDIRIGHPLNFFFLSGNENVYSRETYHYCRGGTDAPLILPNGDVSMCPAWKNLNMFSAGNIYQNNFEEIWNSKYFQTFRKFIVEDYKKLSEPCKNCPDLASCRGKCVAQRLLVQKDKIHQIALEKLLLQGPDPQCYRWRKVNK